MKAVSKKEAAAYECVLTQALNAVDIFKITREKPILIAAADQVEAFTKEFGTRIVFINTE